MKYQKNILFAFALAISFAGLANAGQSDSPADQPTEPSNGKIIFYRPSSFFGAGVKSEIILDGKKVGKSASGKRFSVEVPAGVHHIEIPNSVYSGERTLEVTVQSGGIVYVRTSLGGSAFGGRTNVEQIDPAQGASESEKLKDVSR